MVDNDCQKIPFVTQQLFVQHWYRWNCWTPSTTRVLRLYFFRERIATTLAGLPARKSLDVVQPRWSAVGRIDPQCWVIFLRSITKELVKAPAAPGCQVNFFHVVHDRFPDNGNHLFFFISALMFWWLEHFAETLGS